MSLSIGQLWARNLVAASKSLMLTTTYTRGEVTVTVVQMPHIGPKSSFDRLLEVARSADGTFVEGPIFHSNYRRIITPLTTGSRTSTPNLVQPKFAGFTEPLPKVKDPEGGLPLPLLPRASAEAKIPSAVHARLGASSRAKVIKQPWERWVKNKPARAFGAPLRWFYYRYPHLAPRKYFVERVRRIPTAVVYGDFDMDFALGVGLLLWAFSGHWAGALTVAYAWKYQRENHTLRQLQACLLRGGSYTPRSQPPPQHYLVCWGMWHSARLEVHLLRGGFSVASSSSEDVLYKSGISGGGISSSGGGVGKLLQLATLVVVAYVYSLPLFSLLGVALLAWAANSLQSYLHDDSYSDSESEELRITM